MPTETDEGSTQYRCTCPTAASCRSRKEVWPKLPAQPQRPFLLHECNRSPGSAKCRDRYVSRLRLNCSISFRFLTFLKSRDEILFKGGRFITPQLLKAKENHYFYYSIFRANKNLLSSKIFSLACMSECLSIAMLDCLWLITILNSTHTPF